MGTEVIEQIKQHYDKLMYTIAWNILQNREDAEDVVQEAYLELYRHRLRLLDPESPAARAYVVQTIESRAINLYHKLKRQQTLPLEEAVHQAAPLMETDTELAVCLKKLKAEERQLLLLKYEHGYNVKEIADLLSISVDAAYKLHQRAKGKIEKLYNSQHKGMGFTVAGYGIRRAPVCAIDPDDPPVEFDLEEIFQKVLTR